MLPPGRPPGLLPGGRTKLAGRLAPSFRASNTCDLCWAPVCVGSEGRLMAPSAEAAATERSRLEGLLLLLLPASSSRCRGVVEKVRGLIGRVGRALRPRTRRAA